METHQFEKNGKLKKWVTKDFTLRNTERPWHEINVCPDEIMSAH